MLTKIDNDKMDSFADSYKFIKSMPGQWGVFNDPAYQLAQITFTGIPEWRWLISRSFYVD